MRTLRSILALVAATSLTFSLACGPGGGGSDPEICTDGVDNDDDGLMDCADPDCATNSYCTANPCDNDNICDAGENSTNCPNDCPAVVCDNDNVCDAGENATNCPNDCGSTGTCSVLEDLVVQDGCDTGEKCTLVDANGSLGCETAGSVADYAACGSGGTDDCQAGAICAGPTGGASTCMPFCDTTHACTGGACVGSITTAVGTAKLCMPYDTCDPFDSTGCVSGEACYFVDQAGGTMCSTAGTLAIGASCSYIDDCPAGSGCLGNPGVCTEWCHGDGDCTTGTCQGIGTFPNFSTLGACGTAP